MSFIGQVNVNIYFGTKFDDLNVPLDNNLIRTTATKTIYKSGQVTWQTTWLSNITLNLEDYQEIVGAQYVEFIDNGAVNYGSHWYSVVGYQQLSNKSVNIGLLYDPLLSIGINHITGINGIMRRWTVSNDSHFDYINSTEPINQIDKYNYSYFRHNPVIGTLAIAGFPYDMTKNPEILEYKNIDGESTNIYYPKLKPPTTTTKIKSNVGGELTIDDGLIYYDWQPNENNQVYMTYNNAIALGQDINVNAYLLPVSDLITKVKDTLSYTEINGSTKTVNTNLALVDSGYNNKKSESLGVFFTLYNEVTGDSVTVNSKDLSSSDLEIAVNPYINGNFYARFKGYFNDVNGFSGFVKSASYQPVSISSSVGLATATNNITNVMSLDSIEQSARHSIKQEDTTLTNKMNGFEFNQTMTKIGGVAGFFSSNLLSAPVNGYTSLVNQEYEKENVYRSNMVNVSQIMANRDLQRNQLNVNGTLGQIIPPSFKLANTFNMQGSAYTFIVRKSTLTVKDRQRADRFFTAYGYNVDSEVLNNVNQLKNRSRFTFIMADDVNITSVSGNTDLTRLRDPMTINYIRQRFSSGLRIWKTEPDYNWSIQNSII